MNDYLWLVLVALFAVPMVYVFATDYTVMHNSCLDVTTYRVWRVYLPGVAVPDECAPVVNYTNGMREVRCFFNITYNVCYVKKTLENSSGLEVLINETWLD